MKRVPFCGRKLTALGERGDQRVERPPFHFGKELRQGAALQCGLECLVIPRRGGVVRQRECDTNRTGAFHAEAGGTHHDHAIEVHPVVALQATRQAGHARGAV